MKKKRPVKNILFIDDDLMSNIIHEKIIQSLKSGIDIRTSIDSKEGLRLIKQFLKNDISKFPDIIFLDLNMPGMDGWEFLEELKKMPEFLFKECSVYMLTSSIDHGDIEKTKSFNILREFISKPLTIEKLQTLFSS